MNVKKRNVIVCVSIAAVAIALSLLIILPRALRRDGTESSQSGKTQTGGSGEDETARELFNPTSDTPYQAWEGGEKKTLSEMLSSAPTLSARTSLLLEGTMPSGAQAAQGGTFDDEGKYFYQAYHTGAVDCIVQKYEVKTGKLVKEVSGLPLRHANSLTYNGRENTVVVCYCFPDTNMAVALDADDLSVVRTYKNTLGMADITYNKKRDQYVTRLLGRGDIVILDNNMQPVTEICDSTTRTFGYTTQACACSDDYLFFSWYKPSVITVYDWDMNFVTLIQVDIPEGAELEDLCYLNGELYAVTGGGKGCRVWRVVDLK